MDAAGVGRCPNNAVPLVPWKCLVARLGRSSPLGKSLDGQCLRTNLAVALVSYVPSIVARRSLNSTSSLDFANSRQPKALAYSSPRTNPEKSSLEITRHCACGYVAANFFGHLAFFAFSGFHLNSYAEI